MRRCLEQYHGDHLQAPMISAAFCVRVDDEPEFARHHPSDDGSHVRSFAGFEALICIVLFDSPLTSSQSLRSRPTTNSAEEFDSYIIMPRYQTLDSPELDGLHWLLYIRITVDRSFGIINYSYVHSALTLCMRFSFFEKFWCERTRKDQHGTHLPGNGTWNPSGMSIS
ncbi:hypothetical protein Mp_5g06780 [Marchantia polymorpha subsp. ruderalis]|uniref:Uncharacterized protein n=2 Tax=Marchantia polymorpha TaxID=3197 RepID=A0AAF6BFP5_MARPO|nr:hypothetical protein MARPO_0171s0006 [Marchantia polymorpha]BBN10829.1 hypothetical protein Mp_5g06780 [Marchantia polymorpha subsp. ruderalis]|eukprot:PTQ28163.1 hypothetical protein MARPO_0171s0006 [Marchantia polymorpha]